MSKISKKQYIHTYLFIRSLLLHYQRHKNTALQNPTSVKPYAQMCTS